MLDAGKGMYDTRIMKVKLSPDYNGGPLGVNGSLTMDVVKMNLNKCQWFLPVKLDAYCLGDVMREIKTVIDFGEKNKVAPTPTEEMPFMACPELPSADECAPWHALVVASSDVSGTIVPGTASVRGSEIGAVCAGGRSSCCSSRPQLLELCRLHRRNVCVR